MVAGIELTTSPVRRDGRRGRRTENFLQSICHDVLGLNYLDGMS